MENTAEEHGGGHIGGHVENALAILLLYLGEHSQKDLEGRGF